MEEGQGEGRNEEGVEGAEGEMCCKLAYSKTPQRDVMRRVESLRCSKQASIDCRLTGVPHAHTHTQTHAYAVEHTPPHTVAHTLPTHATPHSKSSVSTA